MTRPLTVRERTAALLSELNDDECLPIFALVSRIAIGRKQYGALDLSTDARNFRRELRDELLDAVAYSVWDDEQAKRKGDGS